MKGWQRFRTLLTQEPWLVEFCSALGLIVSAVNLVFGSADLDGQANWRYLSTLVSDELFGGIMLSFGVAQLVATYLNHKWGRLIMAFITALFWLVLAHSLWLGNPKSPGVAPFLTLGLQNLASVLLIRVRPQRQFRDV